MKIKLIIGLGLLVILLLWSAISIYPDWLWFENLGFSPVFWTMFISRFGFGSVIWLLLMVMVFLNLYAARRLSMKHRQPAAFQDEQGYFSQLGFSTRTLNRVLLACVLILSFVIASRGSQNWDTVLRYLYQKPFGSTDPIFHRDIGFYVFSLPFYTLVRDGFMVFLVFAGLVSTAWYLRYGALQIIGEFSPGLLPKDIRDPLLNAGSCVWRQLHGCPRQDLGLPTPDSDISGFGTCLFYECLQVQKQIPLGKRGNMAGGRSCLWDPFSSSGGKVCGQAQ
jgi:hypothetical protein